MKNSSARIALITGANQGVGFQVAKALVAAGVTVLMGSRDLAKGEIAAGQIGSGAAAYAQVSTAIDHTCAADTAGSVYCWGRNDRSQLGRDSTGDPQCRTEPSDAGITAVACSTPRRASDRSRITCGNVAEALRNRHLETRCPDRGAPRPPRNLRGGEYARPSAPSCDC